MAIDGGTKIECQPLAVDGRQNGASPYALPVTLRADRGPSGLASLLSRGDRGGLG